MIWKQEFTLEGLQTIVANTLPEYLGIEFTEKGKDYLVAKMPVDHRTVQPFRILHGGASAVLSETLGSIAGMLCLDHAGKQGVVGVEINANHLRQVKEGQWVYGKVKPIKLGRKIQVWNTEITDDQGKLACVSRLTIAVIDIN